MNTGLAIAIIAVWGTGLLTGWLLHKLLAKPEVRYFRTPATKDNPE